MKRTLIILLLISCLGPLKAQTGVFLADTVMLITKLDMKHSYNFKYEDLVKVKRLVVTIPGHTGLTFGISYAGGHTNGNYYQFLYSKQGNSFDKLGVVLNKAFSSDPGNKIFLDQIRMLNEKKDTVITSFEIVVEGLP